jgi:catechol 2,3-dioxygenase-like lactoylglutathione lyase family enzyme
VLRGWGSVGGVQVIFAVSDVQRSVAFYERALGWPRNPKISFTNYVEFLSPEGGSLGLYDRTGYAGEVGAEPAALNGHIAPAYLYVRVPDARKAVEAFEAAGGRPLSPLAERTWGERAGWFADPDGNVVAVAEPVW